MESVFGTVNIGAATLDGEGAAGFIGGTGHAHDANIGAYPR
jgi:hypothetical protein